MENGDKIREARERKGWSQKKLGAEVAKLVGLPRPIAQQSIKAIEDNKTQKSKYENEILQILGLANPDGFRPNVTPLAAAALATDTGRGLLPVFAATEGGRGCMVLSTEAVTYTALPDLINRPEDGYGILIIGESMWPEYKPGETALVHKRLPPLSGEAAVFYSDDGHGTVLATIKIFLRATTTHWYVEQHNPKRKFTLLRKDWQTCHRVVGRYNRR